jgi:hypothetical protein
MDVGQGPNMGWSAKGKKKYWLIIQILKLLIIQFLEPAVISRRQKSSVEKLG